MRQQQKEHYDELVNRIITKTDRDDARQEMYNIIKKEKRTLINIIELIITIALTIAVIIDINENSKIVNHSQEQNYLLSQIQTKVQDCKYGKTVQYPFDIRTEVQRQAPI